MDAIKHLRKGFFFVFDHIGCRNCCDATNSNNLQMLEDAENECITCARLDIQVELCSSPNTFCSFPTKILKLPLRELSHASVNLCVS